MAVLGSRLVGLGHDYVDCVLQLLALAGFRDCGVELGDRLLLALGRTVLGFGEELAGFVELAVLRHDHRPEQPRFEPRVVEPGGLERELERLIQLTGLEQLVPTLQQPGVLLGGCQFLRNDDVRSPVFLRSVRDSSWSLAANEQHARKRNRP